MTTVDCGIEQCEMNSLVSFLVHNHVNKSCHRLQSREQVMLQATLSREQIMLQTDVSREYVFLRT